MADFTWNDIPRSVARCAVQCCNVGDSERCELCGPPLVLDRQLTGGLGIKLTGANGITKIQILMFQAEISNKTPVVPRISYQVI